MSNLDFLNNIHAQIIKHYTSINVDDIEYDVTEYWVLIGALYGYDDTHGYEDNIVFKITDDLVSDSYSIESIVKSKNIEELSDDIVKSNINIDDDEWVSINSSVDFSKYVALNKIADEYNFSESALAMFCSTFMQTIQEYANFDNDNMSTTKNQIYKAVINYYANGGIDTILTQIKLVLESTDYLTSDTSTTTTSCCNSATTTSSEISTTVDCATAYENAMYLYLVQMLSDVDFYYDFFFYDGKPIEELCNILIRLIEAFKLMGYDLSFDSSSTTHCGCSNLTKDLGTCNYNILDNYIYVLQWVRDCEIDENSNKIYLYGNAFGTLLPKLSF